MTRTRLAGLAAAAALVGIVVGLPVLLLALGANPVPSRVLAWAELKAALTSPDDGTLALQAVGVIAWAAWLFLTGAVIVEVIARIRGVNVPTLPGLRLPQTTANALVSTALLLFVTAPVLAATAPPASAQPVTADPAPTFHSQHSASDRASVAGEGAVNAVRDPGQWVVDSARARSTVPYTVKRGDSLWSIADEHLGSGLDYPEISALNATVLGGRPGFLTPGTVLALPAAPVPPDELEDGVHQVKVQRGDTMSEIAEEELGDADRYPDIFTASKSTIQPDGRRLTNPDLIDVGWTLTIPEPVDSPTAETTAPPSKERSRSTRSTDPQVKPTPSHPSSRTPARPEPTPSSAPGGTAPNSSSATTSPTSSNGASPSPGSSASVGPPTAPASHAATPGATQGAGTYHRDNSTTDDGGTVAPGWLLTGLTGGGVILAGSMLGLLRVRRRSQSRSRLPGHTIAAPEPALAPVEKTVTVIGTTAVPTVEFLDGVLRRLAAGQATTGKPMPPLVSVEVAGDHVRLHLSDPFDLPAPWQETGDRLSWTVDSQINLDHLGPEVADQPAPYPLLVTVGSSGTGDVWLLNCEQLGTVSITGDRTESADFARYLAAELACNPWAAGVTVDCVGVAHETAAMNPERIRTHRHPADPSHQALAEATAMVERTRDADTDAATARAHQAGADAWPARLLLLNLTEQIPTELGGLLDLINTHPDGTGTAVVLTGETTTARGTVIDLANGRVTVPSANLDLMAVGLTSDEALGCATLLAQAEHTDNHAIPEEPDAEGWRAYANEAGALRTEHTLPRDTRTETRPEPAESILEGNDSAYTQVAATTEDDLAVLAPQVPVRLRSIIEDADPTLDADITAWFSPDCELPRLTLLGPVGARTRGSAIAKRKPYYTELLAYLATRHHGATPDEVAEAFSITAPRVRNDIKILRDWLGTNPRTGRKHLPDARESAAAQARGIGVYQVDDLLVDADLFRRLRVRGETRGPDGITDLQTALKLVTGQPFDKLRPGGWAWMYEGDRLDQHLTCAIVDVAHIVTTQALHDQKPAVARAAAEIAALAAPCEEIPRLNLAAAALAEGHPREATRVLRDDICNRSEDHLPPLELPERTKRVLDNREWPNLTKNAG